MELLITEQDEEPSIIGDEQDPESPIIPTWLFELEVGTPLLCIEPTEAELQDSYNSRISTLNVEPRIETSLSESSALRTTSVVIDNSLPTVPNFNVNPESIGIQYNTATIETKINLSVSQMKPTAIESIDAKLASHNVNCKPPVEQISTLPNKPNRAEFGPNNLPQYNLNFPQNAPVLTQIIMYPTQIPHIPIIKTVPSHDNINDVLLAKVMTATK